jgi:cation/acetate symporter
MSIFWKKLTTRGAVIGGYIGLISALILVILGPVVWTQILGNETAIVPYKFPAVFSVPMAFIAIWFFSITDRSDDAQRCIDEFDAQDIRCQTGIGSTGAVAH